MTALPALVAPVRPMTVAEYAALPEDGEIRYELQEGVLVMMASPIVDHQCCLRELQFQLRDQHPADIEMLPEIDVDLQLVPPTQPATVRRPDLVVVTRAAVERVRREGGLVRAGEVVLIVEIISPSTRRMDTVIKHGEYADAGILHYWIVDIKDRVTLTACHRAATSGRYVDAAPVTGTFITDAPFPVRLELDELL